MRAKLITYWKIRNILITLYSSAANWGLLRTALEHQAMWMAVLVRAVITVARYRGLPSIVMLSIRTNSVQDRMK
jgi:hypothetical protein